MGNTEIENIRNGENRNEKKIYMILTVVAVSAIAFGCKDNSKKNIKKIYNYIYTARDG